MACNVVVVAALAWITAVVIELEHAELRARSENEFQENLRYATWRMDSWLAVFLAREAGRPHTEYRSPSPLLAFKSDYLALHFEIDSDNRISSPQFPVEPPRLDGEAIRARVETAESVAKNRLAGVTEALVTDSAATSAIQALKTQNEYEARVSCTIPPGGNAGAQVEVGRLTPLWLEGLESTDLPSLVFARRVRAGGHDLLQGFVGDWPQLRQRLLFEVRDLFPDAQLRPVSAESAAGYPQGHYLANIPAALVVPLPVGAAAPWVTPGRAALAMAWLAAALAAVAVGLTLQKSIELGERRRRFVSAVTHELRTPLTTFRMYSEMLADGVVKEERQRREYLMTLKEESERLSAMVENVLAHARLEERPAPRRVEPMTLDALLQRVTPPLARCAEASGMSLEVRSESSGDARLEVNPEAILQVLGNLVDNAGKYARNPSAPRVRLEAAVRNGWLTLRVCDHGPGVSVEDVKAIFAPFERGGRDSTDAVPGVGLGLALARGLARDMGGDLTLETSPEVGASFRLDLPT